MTMFRIVDMRAPEPKELQVEAASPDIAARHGLGMNVTRSGTPQRLVCRVYWSETPESRNMVRYYRRVGD